MTLTIPKVWYDYDLQCWVRDGKIAKCGHRNNSSDPLCYACLHVGEEADITHCEDLIEQLVALGLVHTS